MLFTIIKKEGKQLSLDSGFLLIALIQPIIFIVMFGSSFQSGDINHLDTIVIDLDNTTFSSYVRESVDKSEFFDIISGEYTLEEALLKLNRSEVRAVVVIPKDFQNNINNRTAGEIIVHIDSSNFLTYSSLSGAKVEIVKDVLQRVTKNILGELEEEKEEGKIKLDEIRAIFEEVEKETEILEGDLVELKRKGNDVSEFEDLLNQINNSIQQEMTNLNETEEALEDIITAINGIVTKNATEEAKKQAIISQFSSLQSGFDDSENRLNNIINEVNNVDISEITDSSLTKVVDNRFEKIKKLFEEADNKSKDINFEFEKLEKDFLSEPLKITEIESHGEVKYFDYLGAGVLSLIVFFVSLMAPALNIISEKEKNTLYRLSTTPVSSLTIFIGKFIVFMIFGFIEMLYTLFLSVFLYDLRISGNVFDVIFILSLLSFSSISLGLFISSKVKTMQQALVIVPVIVIPSFLISHAFFPPDIMAEFMNYVAYATPMTFSNHALNAVMVKGFSLKDVLIDIYALTAFTIVPLILFIWSYKKIKY